MKILVRWIYALSGILILLFLAPALISARDTLAVLFGVALLVGYAVWSYYYWVKPMFLKIKGELL